MSIKDEINKATEDLHKEQAAALDKFTERTGLKIVSTRWDCAEVMLEGQQIGVKYLRLRSSMETRQL